MAHRIQYRRDTAARWASINPILQEGEVGYETDTHHMKVGDGVHAWNSLEYEVGVGNITNELGNSENLAMSQKGVTNHAIIYAKFKQSTIPTNDVGNDGDVCMFDAINNSRIYIKIGGVWTYQTPSSLSLSNIYRHKNSLYIKEDVENTGNFIEIAKDFASDIDRNFTINTFYNLYAITDRTAFSTKKEAREYWNANISEPHFSFRTHHGNIIYYELEDGNKVLEQFIGETGSAYYFNDTEWVTIWEKNKVSVGIADFTENSKTSDVFIKNRNLLVSKASGKILYNKNAHVLSEDGKWMNIASTNTSNFGVRFINNGKYLSFAPVLYTTLDTLDVFLQVYNVTDSLYVYNQRITIGNKPQQFFVVAELEQGKVYEIMIGNPANTENKTKYFLYNPMNYTIADVPSFIAFEHDLDEAINSLEEEVGTISATLNSILEPYYLYDAKNVPVTTTTTFGKVPIEKGNVYYVYVKSPIFCNFRVYAEDRDEGVGVLQLYGNETDLTDGLLAKITIPKDAPYSAITFRTGIITTLDELSVYTMVAKGTSNKKSSDWSDKVYSSYGDSVTAINNGNFEKPFNVTNNSSWGVMVSDYLGFGKHYGRGIGGQAFRWGSNGGSVCFADSTGIVNSRNDSYNYDNYVGNVEVPAGTTPIRGCSCSWLRIITQYPESIKDEIDLITIMFHNDYSQSYNPDNETVEFVEGNETDPEWKLSSYYAIYDGDYNISTTKGGIASTIMKMQAWMPNAIIVLCTPISGRMDSNVGANTIDVTLKSNMLNISKAVKEVANLMSIPCIDVYGTDGINGLNRDKYISDAIHPYKLAGKKMVARAIIGGLKGVMPNIYTNVK